MVSKNYNIKTFTQAYLQYQFVSCILQALYYHTQEQKCVSYFKDTGIYFNVRRVQSSDNAILLTFDLEIHACSFLKLDLLPWDSVDSGSSMLE